MDMFSQNIYECRQCNFIEDGIIISLQWNFYLIMFEHFICVYIKEIDLHIFSYRIVLIIIESF